MSTAGKAAPKKTAARVQRLLSQHYATKVQLDQGENIQPDADWRAIYPIWPAAVRHLPLYSVFR